MSLNKLVERSAELATLGALFADGRCRAGHVVLVEGASAIGKTALLQAFAHQVGEAGGIFLGASGSSAELDLPLSVVSQLFRGLALSAAEIERAEKLLKDGALMVTARGVGYDADAVIGMPSPILDKLSEFVLGAADRAPLVIGVDDIHHADVASLQFLLYLARRMKPARVLMVLTECLRTTSPHPLLHADLLRQHGSCHLRLRPLSRQGVADVLVRHIDGPTATRLAADCHLASGGNPALVHALIDDLRMHGSPRGGDLEFGTAFRQAVQICLYRSGSTKVARGVAVLAESATPALLGELVRLDAESVRAAYHVLRAAGLLQGERFRHDFVQAAVLGVMRPEERTVLQVKAAELLLSHGTPANVVAERLMAADHAGAPWSVKVLQDAAEQALAAGRASKAIGFLRLVLRDCADEDQRSAMYLDLARATWQVDPAIAAGHLPDLLRGLRERRLPAWGADTLVVWLLWLGRVDDALAAMAETARPHAETGAPRWLLRYTYPGLLPQPGVIEPAVAGTSPHLPVGTLLATALGGGTHEETRTLAERILRESPTAFMALAPLLAVAALVYIDELYRATHWCEVIDQSTAQWPPLGKAIFLAQRALVNLRRGVPIAARECAQEALTVLPPKGWGVLIGIPLSTLVLALIETGRYEDVENHFDTPVPDAMFQTPCVLPYLQARGRYYLAINRPQAALADFQACGELMIKWGFDLPGFVPWRTDLAQAHLAMGNRSDAARLAIEQLLLVSPAQFRTRGRTLRVAAAAAEGAQRAESLGAAVQLLEKSGDQLGLAEALADLSECHRLAGQAHIARTMQRRARQLTADCGVEKARSAPQSADPSKYGASADDPLTELSEAERRVATLAANGYTNRQIAGRLHLTMSTVEQHLTRVYRKLNIRSRTNLPLKLLLLPSKTYSA